MVTPAKQDKRLWLTAGVSAAVLILSALGREPSGGVLGFLGGTVTAYLAQSQWGQTKRTLEK